MKTADVRRPDRFARELFDGLAPRYDRLAEVLSLGQNARWRRAMVDAVVAAEPATVLDVATGSAGVALQIAARSDAQVTAVDLTAQMLQVGAANVVRRGQHRRVHLVQASADRLPFADASFDAVSFTYLLRYVADPAATVRELARVLRPGGVLANLEFHVPSGTLWHPLWLVYTRLGLPLGGLITGGREWYEVGRFLGPSISRHYRRFPLRWHRAAWQAAGIDDVHVRLMSLGGGLVMWGRRSTRRPEVPVLDPAGLAAGRG